MVVFLLAGCASVASRVDGEAVPTTEYKVGDGVVYYMPYRPIKISVTFAAPPPAKSPPQGAPSVETIDATADLGKASKRFLLNPQRSWIGKNHSNIGVTPSGLLTTSTAETTSGISTLIQNIGKAVASIRGVTRPLVVSPVPPPPPCPKTSCPAGSTYTLLLYPDQVLDNSPHQCPDAAPRDATECTDTDTLNANEPYLSSTGAIKACLCGFSITVTDLGGKSPHDFRPNNTAHIAEGTREQYGIFYKQELPYLVTIGDPAKGESSQFIASSPNLAPISYMPVTWGIFADNQTNIVLHEGIVTSVDSVTTGELVALAELPADFITAYTGAIGALFAQLGKNTEAETTLRNNQTALAAATIKQTACTSTIEANRPALEPSNFAGGIDQPALTAATAKLNAALANIQAACK
jgi:hypothetical protein